MSLCALHGSLGGQFYNSTGSCALRRGVVASQKTGSVTMQGWSSRAGLRYKSRGAEGDSPGDIAERLWARVEGLWQGCWGVQD